MKNRNWLIGRNECDLLCEMNGRLSEQAQSFGTDLCIMNCFMSYIDTVARCKKFSDKKDYPCRDCIAAWLNEERR